MKNRTLRLLNMSIAACLAPSAFAAVTLNGEVFNSVTTAMNAAGAVTLTTSPAAVVLDENSKPVPIPLLTSIYQVTVENAVAGGDTAVRVISNGIELEAINCNLPGRKDTHSSHCPTVIVTPSEECGVNYFQTIPWSRIPMAAIIITTGKDGAASKFKTTDSPNYKGYFSAVADTSSGNLLRRMWFSECRDGVPVELVQNYPFKNGIKNACNVSGGEVKLTWTQEVNPASLSACKLEHDKEYYLNYSQSGSTLSRASKLWRGGNYNGTP